MQKLALFLIEHIYIAICACNKELTGLLISLIQVVNVCREVKTSGLDDLRAAVLSVQPSTSTKHLQLHQKFERLLLK